MKYPNPGVRMSLLPLFLLMGEAIRGSTQSTRLAVATTILWNNDATDTHVATLRSAHLDIETPAEGSDQGPNGIAFRATSQD